ncbi:MAG: beta-phosphoglucomutase [Planctomycetota bacterium]|jgi:beta-phosphoglucomutase
MLRGVIFDLDGVLVATDELHYRAWQQVADAEGIHFDREINQRLRGLGRMESLDILLERADRTYTDEQKRHLAERKNAVFIGLAQALGPSDVSPGVSELLAALRIRKIKTAVASSSRNASLIIERLGLAERFDAIVDGNDVEHSKPHPAVFLLAARRLALPPEHCLVIEDAPAGVEAARRAGMAVLGIGRPETLPAVEHLASSLVEVSVDELLAFASH